MADGRLTVRLALGEHDLADDVAAQLEERGHMVVFGDTLEASEPADVVVADGAPRDATTPHVLIGAAPAHIAVNVHAVLAPDAPAEIVAAAIVLAGAGYRIVTETAPGGRMTGHAQLTSREAEVLALLAEGAANKVIARRLDISVHTAKFHVAAIISKLGAVNRTDAIGIAMREGLVHL